MHSYLPEIILLVCVLVIIVTFSFSHLKPSYYLWMAHGGVVGALIAVGYQESLAFNIDHFFKGSVLIISLLTLLLFSKTRDPIRVESAPYLALLVTATLALCVMVTAQDFLTLYVSMEMFGLVTYLLVGSLKGVARSAESATKYLIYGGATTGIFLFGISLLYGLTGTLSFGHSTVMLSDIPQTPIILYVSLVMILAGIGFKIALVPFHMWAPDIYEGAPTSVMPLLSLGSKVAGFILLLRLGISFSDTAISTTLWSPLISTLALLTMTVGHLAALKQKNIKRMLAYSMIAHSGFLLCLVSTLEIATIAALLFVLAIDIMLHGGLWVVVILVSHQLLSDDLKDYRGLSFRGRSGALLATAMTLFILGLAGLPPTAGFAARFHLIATTFQIHHVMLGEAIVFHSLIACTYYFKVMKSLFFKSGPEPVPLKNPGYGFLSILLTLSILTVYLGLDWEAWVQWTHKAALSLISQ